MEYKREKICCQWWPQQPILGGNILPFFHDYGDDCWCESKEVCKHTKNLGFLNLTSPELETVLVGLGPYTGRTFSCAAVDVVGFRQVSPGTVMLKYEVRPMMLDSGRRILQVISLKSEKYPRALEKYFERCTSEYEDPSCKECCKPRYESWCVEHM